MLVLVIASARNNANTNASNDNANHITKEKKLFQNENNSKIKDRNKKQKK